MATKNIINESWEAERVMAYLQVRARKVSVEELQQRTHLTPEQIVAACRDLRNAGLVRGQGPWAASPEGRNLKMDPEILDDPDFEDDEPDVEIPDNV
jgi:hypothetical protein